MRLSIVINLSKVTQFKHRALESELGSLYLVWNRAGPTQWLPKVLTFTSNWAQVFIFFFFLKCYVLFGKGEWAGLVGSVILHVCFPSSDPGRDCLTAVRGAGSPCWLHLSLLLCDWPKEDQQRHGGLQRDLRTAPCMRTSGQSRRSAIYSFSVVKNMHELSFHRFHKSSQ